VGGPHLKRYFKGLVIPFPALSLYPPIPNLHSVFQTVKVLLEARQTGMNPEVNFLPIAFFLFTLASEYLLYMNDIDKKLNELHNKIDSIYTLLETLSDRLNKMEYSGKISYGNMYDVGKVEKLVHIKLSRKKTKI